MINFFAGGALSPKLSRRIKGTLAIFTGCWLGLIWGKMQWSLRQEWCHPGNITKYECEDQVNKIIEDTKKPAVIYYYLPMSPYHHLLRAYMYKYSNQYPDNATWVMVNLVQDFEIAKEGLRNIVFPQPFFRIQARFPKTDLAIYEYDEKEDLKLVKQTVGNRREVFNFEYYEKDFQAFLEEHKIIKGEDPLLPVLQLTQRALFD